MYSGVQQNQLGVQKLHGNKLHLIKAPWFSKFSEGKLHIPLGRRGGCASPIPQGCRYHSRDEIVLRLLFNFLLLFFFNLKTLKRAYIGFWPILQDRVNFWETDFFWHEEHCSIIVFVDLRYVLPLFARRPSIEGLFSYICTTCIDVHVHVLPATDIPRIIKLHMWQTNTVSLLLFLYLFIIIGTKLASKSLNS